MYVNQAIMILYDDDIRGLADIIIGDCKKIDEDAEGWIPTSQLREILSKVQFEILFC